MRSSSNLNTTTSSSAPSSLPHSPWHSPVPYLFGGLAAMMGLIAFALLILACSYWKLSGNFESREGESRERDLENGNDKDGKVIRVPQVFEEKIVVIMAGDEKPTFLATPITSRASSFGDNSNNSCSKEDAKLEKTEKLKQGTDNNQEQSENRVN